MRCPARAHPSDRTPLRPLRRPVAEIAGRRAQCWAASGTDSARVSRDARGTWTFERFDGRTGATRVTTPLRDLPAGSEPCLVATAAGFAVAYRQSPPATASGSDFRLRVPAADGRELADVPAGHTPAYTTPSIAASEAIVFVWWRDDDHRQLGFAIFDDPSQPVAATGTIDSLGSWLTGAVAQGRALAFFSVSGTTLYTTRIDASGRQPDGPVWRSVALAFGTDLPPAAPLGADWLVATNPSAPPAGGRWC